MRSPVLRLPALVGTAAVALTAVAACDSGSVSDADVSAVAAFYPLQFVTEWVGGDHVEVKNLTAPGAEPHDLELEPRQVADITDADLVVYLSGFQPAVDESISQQATETALNVADATELRHGESHDHDHGEDHDHGGVDPHVWLDPIKLADIADAVADRLTRIDPEHADDYTANVATLTDELTAVDEEYAAGLEQCRSRDIVTSHAAFGYLADRYDLAQVSVAGLTPDTEPTSEAIRQVSDYVTEHEVTTVFYETLVDPGVAETIAAETGATTAVLDPIEGLSADSREDYLSVMRSNLLTMEEALGCRSQS